MIKLKLKYYNGEQTEEIIKPTLFPDGTSQIWKIENIAKNYNTVVECEIIWQFEKEEEFIYVSQLSDLLDAYTGYPRPLKILNIPFLPYGRQDKPISNKTTFAQRTFTKLIDTLNFDRVISFDVHGVCAIKNLHKISANNLIRDVFKSNGYQVYCYPDGGACERYFDEKELSINGLKIRDQQTGKIAEYILETSGVNVKGKKILIVDDLLDGGATFIELSKLLKNEGVAEMGLYISHSIASKGYEHLKEAGISSFYFTNSLSKNENLGIKIV